MANKQPVKKKEVTSTGFVDKKDFANAFKTKNNLNGVKDKDLEWIVLPEAFYNALKIPGLAKGFVNLVRGHSNTGKSTIKLQAIAECQRQGILPVIYETESNFPWDHARMCGVEFEDVMGEVVNVDTGEVETKVVDHSGFFLYFDQEILFNQYGKMDYSQGKELSKPARKIAVIEDVAYSINDLLDQQGDGEGEIPYEMFFVWDSIGTLPCYRSVLSKTGNNMFDAAATKQSFNTIVNNRIPISRKETSKYTNTFLGINKVWLDNMGAGAAVVKNSGGDGLGYASRLVIHVGGIVGASVEKLSAEVGGVKYYYGIQTKIRTEKNQVNDITYEGKICSLPHGLWTPDKLNEYKKNNMKFLMKRLSELGGNDINDANDVNFKSEETED